MKIDFHVHSIYSDGIYSINELVELFKGKLDGFALTDHDTINGLFEIEKYNEINIIPGIEFSCQYKDNDIHILGLNIDYKNKALFKITEELKVMRYNRGIKFIENFVNDNFNIDTKDILENETVGRPHIARELIKNGYAKDMNDAFTRYLTKGSKYFVDKEYLTINKAIDYIHNANGLAILAHPGEIVNLDLTLKYIKSTNIDGIEIFHPSNDEKLIEFLLEYSNENNYIITGGSDFHSDINVIGNYYIDDKKTIDMILGKYK